MLNIFKSKKKYFLLLVVILLFFSGVLLTVWNNFFKEVDKTKEIVCAVDMKICPDGTVVLRDPPDCNFSECSFEIVEMTNKSCRTDKDCALPITDDKRSGCPKEGRCIDSNKCAVACLSTTVSSTTSLDRNWQGMKNLIAQCQVAEIMQTYTRQVVATLKNGYSFSATEPAFDDVLKLVRMAEEKCGKVSVVTE
ncbi:MAG TPA: hypothetical protein VJH75_03100 [Patescibacteria group bacterium]|nr:hypothetical protein [Patescibacteria group bacterium]